MKLLGLGISYYLCTQIFNLLSLLISIHQELDPIKAFKNFQPRRMFYAFNAYLNLVYIRVSEVNLVASQATCTK